MALRFYLRQIVSVGVSYWMERNGPANNYATLLEWLERASEQSDGLLLVTFNYDPMLDNARRIIHSVDPESTESYLESPVPFRPHGYVAWSHLARREPDQETKLIDTADSYQLADFIVPRASSLRIVSRQEAYRLRRSQRLGRWPIGTEPGGRGMGIDRRGSGS